MHRRGVGALAERGWAMGRIRQSLATAAALLTSSSARSNALTPADSLLSNHGCVPGLALGSSGYRQNPHLCDGGHGPHPRDSATSVHVQRADKIGALLRSVSWTFAG